ncbi:hypothetical protein H4582DRAFT_2058674 [Lactarius indigo]|nr:hypothetical protein H4582DRAFT_2058674 [Lactarius indigo]
MAFVRQRERLLVKGTQLLVQVEVEVPRNLDDGQNLRGRPQANCPLNQLFGFCAVQHHGYWFETDRAGSILRGYIECDGFVDVPPTRQPAIISLTGGGWWKEHGHKGSGKKTWSGTTGDDIDKCTTEDVKCPSRAPSAVLRSIVTLMLVISSFARLPGSWHVMGGVFEDTQCVIHGLYCPSISMTVGASSLERRGFPANSFGGHSAEILSPTVIVHSSTATIENLRKIAALSSVGKHHKGPLGGGIRKGNSITLSSNPSTATGLLGGDGGEIGWVASGTLRRCCGIDISPGRQADPERIEICIGRWEGSDVLSLTSKGRINFAYIAQQTATRLHGDVGDVGKGVQEYLILQYESTAAQGQMTRSRTVKSSVKSACNPRK